MDYFMVSSVNGCQEDVVSQVFADELELTWLDSIFDTDDTSAFHVVDSNNCSLLELPDPDFHDCEVLTKSYRNVSENYFSPALVLSQRQLKIKKYLEKKRKRNWHKKISYSCRKKVADQRIRVKGRFVSKQQAITLSASNPLIL